MIICGGEKAIFARKTKKCKESIAESIAVKLLAKTLKQLSTRSKSDDIYEYNVIKKPCICNELLM